MSELELTFLFAHWNNYEKQCSLSKYHLELITLSIMKLIVRQNMQKSLAKYFQFSKYFSKLICHQRKKDKIKNSVKNEQKIIHVLLKNCFQYSTVLNDP